MRGVIQITLVLATAILSAAQTKSLVKHSIEWNPTELSAKQTIDAERSLSESDRTLLKRAVAKQFDTDYQSDVAISRFKAIDLNNDGIAEIVVQASGQMCSPTGNCPFWIFQKTATGYKVILSRGSVQTFSIEKARHNGYMDIVVGMHGSAFEQTLHKYQFRNGQYRNVGCYESNWAVLDKNGEFQELKQPRITACK